MLPTGCAAGVSSGVLFSTTMESSEGQQLLEGNGCIYSTGQNYLCQQAGQTIVRQSFKLEIMGKGVIPQQTSREVE